MSLFEEIAKRDIKCEVCGSAEYEFPTTTEAKHDKRMDDYRA